MFGAAGGVGLAAVQIGHLLGATVIAVASTAEKRALAARHGAAITIDRDAEGWRERLKAAVGGGIDVVFDPVCGPLFQPAFRSLNWGGRHLVVGFVGGPIPALPANLPLMKGASLVGVDYRQFAQVFEAGRADAELDELLGWVGTGRLDPPAGRIFSFAEYRDALTFALERRRRGKDRAGRASWRGTPRYGDRTRMKLVTIKHQGHRKVGAIRPGTDRIWLLKEMLGRPVGDMLSIIPELDTIRKTASFSGEGIAASDIRIEAPIPRPARNVFCVGKNYHEHAKEFARSGFDSSASSAADAIPTAPIIFTKVPEMRGRRRRRHPLSRRRQRQLDYEAELAVVIGRGGRGIPQGTRLRPRLRLHDRQRRDGARPAGAPQAMVPRQVARHLLPDGPVAGDAPTRSIRQNLASQCWVNDELRQDANTRDLIFDIPTLIETISAGMTLLAGRRDRHRHAGRRRHRLHAAEVPAARRSS